MYYPRDLAACMIGNQLTSYLLSRDGYFVGFFIGLLLDEFHHLVDLTLDL